MLGLVPSAGRVGGQRGRSSTSPTRTDNEQWSSRTRSGSSEIVGSSTVLEGHADNKPEDVRSFSPDRRKAELERRVSERVKFYIKLNNVSAQLVEPAVEALVRMDLELIPLLEDPGALLVRIAETVANLQSDPDIPMDQAAPASFPPPSPLSIPEQDRLHAEVERIDPMEVDQIMDILLATVDVHELRHCLSSKSYLAATYNVAKKELIRRQETSTSERDLDSSMSSRLPRTSTDEAAPALEKDSHSPVSEPISPLDLNTVNIETLAALPARNIMAHLTADSSDVLLMKISVSRPTASSVLELVKWSEAVLKKEPAARKSDIATRLAKALGLKYKRSQKIKVAAAIVNEEPDDEAMCKL